MVLSFLNSAVGALFQNALRVDVSFKGMYLRFLKAVHSFFQNACCITVGRSSPASARVSGPSDLKECMVNAVRSPALRACALLAPLSYLVLIWASSPNRCSRVWLSGATRENVPLCHVPSQCSPYCDVLLNCSYGACGHTRS